MVFGFIGVVAIALVEVFSKGPFQELKILVDLPANTNVEVAPLLLNSVDASLFGFLLPKCTQTVDHEQILLYYKGHGEIYDQKRSVFTVKGAIYKPTRLKVVYCSPP
jgi:hypothetical protein